MRQVKIIPAVLICAGVLLVIFAVLFRDTARIVLSAVISVLLLVYLLYLILHRELRCSDKEESVLYLELEKKPRFCVLYISDKPSDSILCAYKDSHFVKLRIQQTDRFICPMDMIRYHDNDANPHTILILRKIRGTFFNEKNYRRISAGILGILIFVGILSINARQTTGKNLTKFLENHTAAVSVSPVTGTIYNPADAFQDFRFLLTVCEGPDNTAEFIKLICINGDNYQLDVISLNKNLMLRGKRFGDEINDCISRNDYMQIGQLVSDYFSIRIDNFIFMNYEPLCAMFDADCISLSVSQELYQMKYTASHRDSLHVDGSYSYQEAVGVIAALQYYTEQCTAQGKTGTYYLEQIVSELQNDLLYSMILNISGQTYNTQLSCSDCLLTDMTKSELKDLNSRIHYRRSTFRNQFQNTGNQTVIPYLSDCEIIYTESGEISAYVPDGYLDSRIIREFYYTIAGK